MTNSEETLGWVGLRGKFLRRRKRGKRIERKLEGGPETKTRSEPRGAWFLFGRCLLLLLLLLLTSVAQRNRRKGPKFREITIEG